MTVVPIYDHPEETKAFVERGLWNGHRQFGACVAIGFANAHEGLVAGFVYHNYDPDTGVIEVSGYSSQRKWATKELLKVIFEYPFNQLNARLVVARHSEHNKRVRRIWRSIGALEYVIPELRSNGEAEAISVLSRNAWNNSKFMRSQNG